MLLKNEYGDVEVDSLLAQQSSIAGVSEILNGCMCCTLVGQIQTAMLEIRDKMNPDRIIIESSGSAFPATLALQIRSLASEGFSLDSIVTVVDCINFRGYEDSSPTAKIQARYTDCLVLNKYDLVSERELDDVLDHLYELNDETPVIRVSKSKPLTPELVFGLDTKLFLKEGEETAEWEQMGAGAKGSHSDEIETRSIWRGGKRPGSGQVKSHDGCAEGCEHSHMEEMEDDVVMPVDLQLLEEQLKKLPFEIYRVKGILRMRTTDEAVSTFLLNWAFGRFELHPFPSLDTSADLHGVSSRLTMMGTRGEVARRAKVLAAALGAQCA